MKNQILLFLFLFVASFLNAQVGGDNVYEFVNLSSSARISALGGNLITVRDDDVNLAFDNPAAANPAMHQAIAFSHNFFLSDINHGYAAYAHYAPKWDLTLHGGIKYISYGQFDRTDIFGNTDGSFKAGEYALALGAGRQLYERLAVGANLKFVSSQLESYNSFGVMGDLAGIFLDTASNFTATLVFKNIGGQLSTYHDGLREKAPFEIQAGISKRLKYLPFRFSIIFHNLQRWNILYDDPNQEDSGGIFGDLGTQDSGNPWVDNLFRHFIFNGEFLFGKKENFRVRLGYNHFRHKEMTVNNFRSLAGFSFGAGIKINRFRLDYGREIWHLAGGVNHISISTSIKEFVR